MAKVLGIISDTHSDHLLRSHTIERTGQGLREIRHTCAIKAMQGLQENTDFLIHGGDLFHRGRSIDVTGFSLAYQQSSLCDFVLQGNHDKLADNRKSVFDVLYEVQPRLSHLSLPEEVVALPYQPTQEKFEAAVERLRPANVAILHCELDQIPDTSGLINMITPEVRKILLNKFDKVFVGHRHNPSKNPGDRIVSIGSHYPLSFADLVSSDIWGVWEYDIGTSETIFKSTAKKKEIYYAGSEPSGAVFVDLVGIPVEKIQEAVKECYTRGALAVRFSMGERETVEDEILPKEAVDVVEAVTSILPNKFKTLLKEQLKKQKESK